MNVTRKVVFIDKYSSKKEASGSKVTHKEGQLVPLKLD